MNIPKGSADLSNCAKCLDVKQCIDESVKLAKENEKRVRAALDPRIDRQADQVFEAMSNADLEVLKELSGSSIIDGASLVVACRQITAEWVEAKDELIEANSKKIESLTTGCEGPLIMRARKSGRVVTATICNSPTKLDGAATETVLLQRDRHFD